MMTTDLSRVWLYHTVLGVATVLLSFATAAYCFATIPDQVVKNLSMLTVVMSVYWFLDVCDQLNVAKSPQPAPHIP